MASNNTYNQPVGIIGAGSFGCAVANILAENVPVIMYARNPEVVDEINYKGSSRGIALSERVKGHGDLEQLAATCEVIFPVVPSGNFREMITKVGPFLKPYHILIHGTKGFVVELPEDQNLEEVKFLRKEEVFTMSELIRRETSVVRIGCLAGPNLAKEINEHQPAATVVASRFDEVIDMGQQLLKSERFRVYGNNDLIGVELCGVLKNIIAIAAGALSGLGYGENTRGLLISRGMVEMIYLGQALGGNVKAFLGLAGVGDLVATCTSRLSRNYSLGFRLAQGETLPHILGSMDEVAEGVNTIKITKRLADNYRVRAPITTMLHQVLYEDLPLEEALQYLMKYPFIQDIDFL
ncbi:MAG: NAD(P)-dependent glycerol-3-phosphate dehydrogenase [Cyclobacteriaceae bacterium]|nr:NAD(P)-dependent glycerol-3-phosphate dehydrogenase [Cyclobacteriaceae bacterium]